MLHPHPAMMDAASYDGWYDTPRGRWIGEREAALVLELLQPRPGESLLDVGCGTGFFTRAFAAALDGPVTGVDIQPSWLDHARRRAGARADYVLADARALPFADTRFDLVVSIAALCFIEPERTAIHEILRVARRRFAIGLLNRQSLLWLRKGRGGGRGGYRGAQWHTVSEVRRLFRGLPARHLCVRTAIKIPNGGRWARVIERALPDRFWWGGFILVAGDVTEAARKPLRDVVDQR